MAKKAGIDDVPRFLELMRKYSKRGSFYTDYPILGHWHNGVQANDYEEALEKMVAMPEKHPHSLYVHYPYCPRQCLFCQCVTIISKSKERSEEYLKYLGQEIDLVHDFYEKRGYIPNIMEIHLGGGTPSILNQEEFAFLNGKLNSLVDTRKLDEYTIEIDPRWFEPEMLDVYHEAGINRISIGIQDFDPKVEKGVNRINPPEMVARLITPDKRRYFQCINFDLIYGMPYQTRESMRKTIEEVIRLGPDRIAFSVLGYRPDVFRHQKAMDEEALPSLDEKVLMNLDAIEALLNAGYERIGIDYFSKPTDGLAIAKRNGALHRNAQGYTPGRVTDIISFGVSGQGRLLEWYFQNHYDEKAYFNHIKEGKFPIMAGYRLDKDLMMRREIMHKIVNYSRVDFADFEQRYGINFKAYFKEDLGLMREVADDGLAVITDEEIRVTSLGMYFHRNICTAFDILLRKGVDYKHARERGYERTVLPKKVITA